MRKSEQIPDTLLLLEHPPVITLGKRGSGTDILLSREMLNAKGVDVVEIDRGGQVTYHGPGQMVGYFICNLYEHQRKVRRFVQNIENSVITFLKESWNIEATTDPKNVGVWTSNGGKYEKIAAIGISIFQGITMHGFALNITTDLSHFGWIVPCGITDKGVTSVKRILEERNDKDSLIPMDTAKRKFADIVKKVFEYDQADIHTGIGPV